jgi:hypothetical protein
MQEFDASVLASGAEGERIPEALPMFATSYVLTCLHKHRDARSEVHCAHLFLTFRIEGVSVVDKWLGVGTRCVIRDLR